MIMKRKILISIIIGIVLLSSITAGGHIVSAAETANYTVNSLSSLQNVINNVQPGDLVYIRGGTYQPTSQLRFTKSGVPGNPITWSAYPGERVIFDGSSFSKSGWQPPLLHITGNWNVFNDFEIRNNSIGRGIYVNAGDSIFKNIVSHNHGGSGIYCVNSYRNQFIDIVAYANIDPPDGGRNADGISLESGAGNIVRYSRFYENSDDGLDTWQSTGNLIENCVSYHNGLLDGNGNGFKLGPGGNNIVRRCVSYDNNKPVSLAGGRGFTSNGGSGNLVEHCTSYDNAEYEFLNFSGTVNTYRDNIALGTPNAMIGAIHSYNTWNVNIADPKFISTYPASTDYLSLRSDSPCRDKASDGTDLGALQYGKKITDLIAGGSPLQLPLNNPQPNAPTPNNQSGGGGGSPQVFASQTKYNSDDNVGYTTWKAQTFIPQVDHIITSVKLMLGKRGNPSGNFVVSIKATDANGLPTGPDLASGSMPCSAITVPYTNALSSFQLCEFTLSPAYNVKTGVKYAIVMRAQGLTSNDERFYYLFHHQDQYNRGNICGAWDVALTLQPTALQWKGTWGINVNEPTADAWFQEWGNPR
jgi:hypothetical protein